MEAGASARTYSVGRGRSLQEIRRHVEPVRRTVLDEETPPFPEPEQGSGRKSVNG